MAVVGNTDHSPINFVRLKRTARAATKPRHGIETGKAKPTQSYTFIHIYLIPSERPRQRFRGNKTRELMTLSSSVIIIVIDILYKW